ncbi:MAG: ATP-dependent DNA ligase [Vicinamibacterales bacterium]
MKRFADLFAAIDHTTSTNTKVDAMVAYFSAAPAADAAWATFFLTGRRLKRLLPYKSISQWTMTATGVSEWLLGECHAVVGDGAETATLILDQLPAAASGPLSLAEWVEGRILALRDLDAREQQRRVITWVRELTRWERFTLLKLLTGELRLGVSQTLVVRALANVASLPPTTIAARLMGEWTPDAEWHARLIAPAITDDDLSRPFPFCLASPLEGIVTPQSLQALLGPLGEWQAEWKWDGIRAQIVKRAGHTHLWSRGEELITQRFPEIIEAAHGFGDGTVLDGEVLAFRDDRPLPFSALQQRIGRERNVSRTARDVPVVFMAYDVLEHEGRDVRSDPLLTRRSVLESIVARAHHLAPAAPPPQRVDMLLPFDDADAGATRPQIVRASPTIAADTWEDLGRARLDSRRLGVEGVMIKRLSSAYTVGRKRGDWWKWKIDPHTIDAVLIYAQPGSGKRASLLTDYTFGLWHNGELVPVAKAYSGLTNEEIAEMDRWIRRHTVERFGPVRHVEPTHVFELGFEAIARSGRHRSGIAVRFPRMLRWRKDKPASEADTLEALQALLEREHK